MPRDAKIIVRIILDIILILAVGLPILIFHLAGKPNNRGFFCDDDSIRYPFYDSTITTTVLYIVGVFLPITTITFIEFTNEANSAREDRGHVYLLLGRPVPNVVWRIYKKIGVFLFGCCLSQLTTDIAKYTIGRHRPHFISICKPDYNCSLASDPHYYVEKYNCLGEDVKAIREARLSFPSGHSSFSAYCMVFTVIYLQANMRCQVNKLLKPFLQFVLLMMTWYTALSRISDYKHHWSDVMIGFLQGALVAVIVTYFVSDFFEKQNNKGDEIVLREVSAKSRAANYNTMNVSDVEQQLNNPQ